MAAHEDASLLRDRFLLQDSNSGEFLVLTSKSLASAP